MLDAQKCIETCKEMPREVFYDFLVKGVGKMPEFSHLMCLGAQDLDDDEKKRLCVGLQQAGVPAEYSEDDDFLESNLTDICRAITNRMVKLG